MENQKNKSKYIVEFIKTNLLNIIDPTEEELKCLDIISKSLSDPDSRVLFRPKNEERVIFWYNRNISILIEHKNVTIVHERNHRSCYIENVKVFNEIVNKFDARLESDFNVIVGQIAHSKEKFFHDVFDFI